ncbi:helix-turn-helix domain-containing protein [Erwinia mallotivora]|uniref:AlbA family DNA-binding domain-containing protein n=1 Tax=Erwinia mallotivora TaxID=69222 RepID=UPI0021C234D0|nr:ATP-binding protein [Erwinia mallotivora]
MANGRGGWVVLGVKEQAGKLTPVGIADPEKIKADLFNQLNDRDRFSANVLRSENDVQQISLQGADVLAIYIPQAMRKQKPVHLKKSPFSNTYQRLHEGDRVCDDMTVKRIIDDVDNLTEALRDSLFTLAAVPRERLRLGDKALMKSVILNVCQGPYISVAALEQILSRNPNALRQQYLKPLVEQGELKLAFPQYKNDPKQGYSAV